jgi:hypothetical protein
VHVLHELLSVRVAAYLHLLHHVDVRLLLLAHSVIYYAIHPSPYAHHSQTDKRNRAEKLRGRCLGEGKAGGGFLSNADNFPKWVWL